VLEAEHITHARIEDKARFVGLGGRFQIWSPTSHQALMTEMRRLALESVNLLEAVEEDDTPVAAE
jgi:DNA-binding transcriptional regulator/RsmH inhibitor MraZ